MIEGECSAVILERERALLRAEVRSDRATLELMLAPDFIEIGSSGRVYSRREMIDALLADPGISEPLTIENLSTRALSAGVVLMIYVAIGQRTGRRVNRSTIWIRDSGDWRMAFHQGTVAEQARS